MSQNGNDVECLKYLGGILAIVPVELERAGDFGEDRPRK